MADLPDFAEARERAEAYLNDSLQAQGVITPHERKLARDVLVLHAAWEAATAERDDLERVAFEGNEREKRLEGHVTALREALNRAQRDIVSIVLAGFDSTRSEIAARALKRIADALAGLDEPPEQQEARPSQTDGTRDDVPTVDSSAVGGGDAA